MAFPILGTPKPQFSDSSGSPFASGTLAILDPANDTNKASYPTANDADALTNANVNPIVLNARGAPPVGLYGIDGEDYKYVLKDVDGATIDTQDDILVPQFTAAITTRIIKFPTTAIALKGIAPSIIIGVQSYTTGAHAALRDFTGTTTAAQALQLLETLVDDLVQKGSL